MTGVLICGAEAPLAPRVAARLVNEGFAPTVFHNNNAGKHLSILATCSHRGEPIEGYEKPDHPAQQRLRQAIERRCEISFSPSEAAIDNCGLPTWPISPRLLALGMAKVGATAHSNPGSAEAQLIAAIGSAPEFFGGSRRFATLLLKATEGRVIAKGGSEGVFAVTVSEWGVGIVIKVNDGSGEAATAVLVELLGGIGLLPDGAVHQLRERVNIWRRPERPERSLTLEFPAFSQLKHVELSRQGRSGGRVTTSRISRGSMFNDPEGRQFIDMPFRYGILRHRNLADDAVDGLIGFVSLALEQVAAYLGVEPASGIIIQIVGRDNRSMTFLRERRIRISEMRLPHASCLHHELTHLLAGASPRGAAFTEGLAVHVQSLLGGLGDRSYPTYGRDLHAQASAWLSAGGDASPLLSMQSNGAANPDKDVEERQADYLLCGSFVRFLINKAGMKSFMDMYRIAHPDFDVSALETSWRQELGRA